MRAFHFDVVMHRVACAVHKFSKEEAALFCLGIAAEHFGALALEAGQGCRCVVVFSLFAIGEEFERRNQSGL